MGKGFSIGGLIGIDYVEGPITCVIPLRPETPAEYAARINQLMMGTKKGEQWLT